MKKSTNNQNINDLEKKIKNLEATYEAKLEELMNYIKSNPNKTELKHTETNPANNENFLLAISPSDYINNIFLDKLVLKGKLRTLLLFLKQML
jgi:hypothetical protein